MSNQKIIDKFENELDEWLKSQSHLYNCDSYAEGQFCCLDKQSAHLPRNEWENGRQFIINFISKLNLKQ